jgi:hypothetical protein
MTNLNSCAGEGQILREVRPVAGWIRNQDPPSSISISVQKSISMMAAFGYALYLCKLFLSLTLLPAQATINISAAMKNKHIAYVSLYLLVPGMQADSLIA